MTSEQQSEFTCPECGKTFTRAASLGAHRRRAHGVAGASQTKTRTRRRARTTTAATASATTATRRRRARQTAGRTTNGRIDRDALLHTIFPNGVPAREEVMKQANAWLDEAERLAQTK